MINTALLPSGANKLAYGHGILQILAAYEYFKTTMVKFPEGLVNFEAVVRNPKKLKIKGIKITNPRKNEKFVIELESKIKADNGWFSFL